MSENLSSGDSGDYISFVATFIDDVVCSEVVSDLRLYDDEGWKTLTLDSSDADPEVSDSDVLARRYCIKARNEHVRGMLRSQFSENLVHLTEIYDTDGDLRDFRVFATSAVDENRFVSSWERYIPRL
ncbi:hypothetical protein AURDEDRAFT_165521 [Auricularia subglabra TFB-10046 SS5]|nr:hypothetical protein AURDEDRAFT_165521 [Auricularia subglabra TFB-10046 SS5]